MKDKNKAKGSMFGLAVGDALGTAIEFSIRDTYEPVTNMRGGGPFKLNPGEWTDDTSMALALAQALVDHKGVNRVELLKNFSNWYQHGEFAHNNRCFDIGRTTRNALNKFFDSGETDENPATTDFLASGNGGIMRLAPAVLAAKTLDEAINFSVEQSTTTHASLDCVKVAAEMGNALWTLLNEENGAATFMVLYRKFLNKHRIEVSSSGYVVDTFDAACWAVVNTDNFKDAVLLAVNLGDDADTVGAVTGQIAGSMYGFDSIP